MKSDLLPLTLLVLVTTTLALLVFAIVDFFAPRLIHNVLWPSPFEPQPDLWLRFDALFTMGLSLGGLYVLRENNWLMARPYLLVTGVWVALDIILSVLTAATMPVPAILWLYVVLAIIYVPLLVFAWRQQSAQATAR